MTGMFMNATSLTTLNINNFDTSNVTLMNSTFRDCNSLSNLNLNTAIFDKVSNKNNMFLNTKNSIIITTKNSDTKTWLENRMSEAGITGATIQIVS